MEKNEVSVARSKTNWAEENFVRARARELLGIKEIRMRLSPEEKALRSLFGEEDPPPSVDAKKDVDGWEKYWATRWANDRMKFDLEGVKASFAELYQEGVNLIQQARDKAAAAKAYRLSQQKKG